MSEHKLALPESCRTGMRGRYLQRKLMPMPPIKYRWLASQGTVSRAVLVKKEFEGKQ